MRSQAKRRTSTGSRRKKSNRAWVSCAVNGRISRRRPSRSTASWGNRWGIVSPFRTGALPRQATGGGAQSLTYRPGRPAPGGWGYHSFESRPPRPCTRRRAALNTRPLLTAALLVATAVPAARAATVLTYYEKPAGTQGKATERRLVLAAPNLRMETAGTAAGGGAQVLLFN